MKNLEIEFSFWYQAQVERIIDGDTLVLKIDMGRRIYIVDSIRLRRINAPELSQPMGKEIRDHLKELLPPGTEVRIQTFKNSNDKYGRWLGEVYFIDYANGGDLYKNLNNYLVAKGFATHI